MNDVSIESKKLRYLAITWDSTLNNTQGAIMGLFFFLQKYRIQPNFFTFINYKVRLINFWVGPYKNLNVCI